MAHKFEQRSTIYQEIHAPNRRLNELKIAHTSNIDDRSGFYSMAKESRRVLTADIMHE